MREENDVERLIDASLSTYAAADPDLEQRVLARISAQSAPSRRRWLPWAVAFATAACVLLFILFFVSKNSNAPSVQTAASPKPPATTPHIGPPASLPPVPARRAKTASLRLPKRDTFPTPQPLSPEERALAAFGAKAPESERQSFLLAQKHWDEPIHMANIHIDAISIPPLEPPQAGAN